MEEVVGRINKCKTMPELDDIRLDVVNAMTRGGESDFYKIQKVFIKKKNKLQRIPLKDRAW